MKERITSFFRTHRVDIVIFVVLFIVAAIPRLTDLGAFLTADEKNWIGRSYEFIRAFKDFRFNDMLQTTHPGVTALWAMGVAVTAKMFVSDIPFSFNNLFHFVKAAQFPVALLNTLAVPVIYIFLRKLFVSSTKLLVTRYWLPVTSSLLIALDPVIIGYSRVAHIDALLMSFLFLAALATIIYAQTGYSRRWLITSAVLSALAVLSKAPAIFIVPFFGLVILAYEGKRLFTKNVLKERFRDFVTWGLIVGILFVVLWPAILWVPDPKGNVLLLKRDLGTAALTPHHMAEDYTLNAWHYPAALLSRTNPVTLIFGSIGIVGILVHLFKKREQENNQYSLPGTRYGLLIAYILFFVLMMTLGAKKGDRYILPVWPALHVLGAIGFFVFVEWFRKQFELRIKNYELSSTVRRALPISLFLIPVFYLAFTVYSYHPYEIAYSNPLFPDNLSQELGWGEGLEQVGAWLSENAPGAVVASWYPEELGAYTSAQVAHINAHEQNKVRYVVLYRNMFGRAPDHYANDFIDEYYTKREPVFVAHVVGKEFAWVYEKPVYERIVGELTPGVRVGQQIDVPYDRSMLAAIDVLIATYSGKAAAGEVVVNVKEDVDGRVLHSFTIPVAEIEDDQYLTVLLPEEVRPLPETVFVEIFARGTAEGDAPTVRYTRDFNYRKSDFLLSDDGFLSAADEKQGDLAIRFRYRVPSGELATEQHTRLLKERH